MDDVGQKSLDTATAPGSETCWATIGRPDRAVTERPKLVPLYPAPGGCNNSYKLDDEILAVSLRNRESV